MNLPDCCPRCLASRRADGYNRLGWYRYECDRDFSPSLGAWRISWPSGCLSRQLDQAHDLLREGRILSSLSPQTAKRKYWRHRTRDLENRSNR